MLEELKNAEIPTGRNEWLKFSLVFLISGTAGRTESDDAEVARLIETLALGSVSVSTKKEYLSKWRTWVKERARRNLGPWLSEEDGIDSAVTELTRFMASRCFVHKNQSGTVRGYLAAIKHFHKMFAGWELPTSHCMIVAVGKGIDRAHGKSDVRPKVRKPLTWEMLIAGREAVEQMGETGSLMWKGLALSYLLLCRASEIWAYGNGLVHSEFCLTRGDIAFCNGPTRLVGSDRRRADRVEVLFRASKADQKRVGATITRTRVRTNDTERWGGEDCGAVEILLDLFESHSELGEHAPLMQATCGIGWQVISRAAATRALRILVGSLGNDPQQYALHSGRIGGATHLARCGATAIQIKLAGRWKSTAFMVYVRAGGEGAEFVSRALTRNARGIEG